MTLIAGRDGALLSDPLFAADLVGARALVHTPAVVVLHRPGCARGWADLVDVDTACAATPDATLAGCGTCGTGATMALLGAAADELRSLRRQLANELHFTDDDGADQPVRLRALFDPAWLFAEDSMLPEMQMRLLIALAAHYGGPQLRYGSASGQLFREALWGSGSGPVTALLTTRTEPAPGVPAKVAAAVTALPRTAPAAVADWVAAAGRRLLEQVPGCAPPRRAYRTLERVAVSGAAALACGQRAGLARYSPVLVVPGAAVACFDVPPSVARRLLAAVADERQEQLDRRRAFAPGLSRTVWADRVPADLLTVSEDVTAWRIVVAGLVDSRGRHTLEELLTVAAGTLKKPAHG